MRTAFLGATALTAGAIGSLITPSIRLYQTLTEPISQSEISDARRANGITVSADTIRSNHVIVDLVVLGGYIVLALALLLAARGAARGGRVSSAVAIVAMLVGAVVWSGSAVDGAAGWLLRGIITIAGVAGVALVVSAGSRRRHEQLPLTDYPWPPAGSEAHSPYRSGVGRR